MAAFVAGRQSNELWSAVIGRFLEESHNADGRPQRAQTGPATLETPSRWRV